NLPTSSFRAHVAGDLRGFHVVAVQTCPLPISSNPNERRGARPRRSPARRVRFIVSPFTRRPLPRRPRSDLLRQTAPTSRGTCAETGRAPWRAITQLRRRTLTDPGELPTKTRTA